MAAAISELPPLQQRKVSAIVGACVADAAAQPLHWVYSDGTMTKLTEGKQEIEFRQPSANPFYRIPTGSNTCYGDQAYATLKSLVESKGVNTDHLTSTAFDVFGPKSAYETLKKSLPLQGPWRHGCIKDFLANMAANKKPVGSQGDDQIDCAIRVIPVAAMYAGHPDMLVKAEEALRVLQESDLSIACGLAAARVLELYILTGNPDNALETVINKLSDPANSHPQELDKAVVGFLRSVLRAKGTAHSQAVSNLFAKN